MDQELLRIILYYYIKGRAVDKAGAPPQEAKFLASHAVAFPTATNPALAQVPVQLR
ncbi:hypothetical protein [Kamptonema formosum]|uniref:hypothetical protein n=1 Tax=Kamptonema formosum TaxID=331992 RepID=UPI00034BF2D7|nr:hypothetical protein [Oscillatoria sp. PCC 10802]